MQQLVGLAVSVFNAVCTPRAFNTFFSKPGNIETHTVGGVGYVLLEGEEDDDRRDDDGG